MIKEEIEKNVSENGLKKSFIGTIEKIIDEMKSFFIDAQIENEINKVIILNIKSDLSRGVTIDEIGLINDTIQEGMGNQASIIMHILEDSFPENHIYEIELRYLLEK